MEETGAERRFPTREQEPSRLMWWASDMLSLPDARGRQEFSLMNTLWLKLPDLAILSCSPLFWTEVENRSQGMEIPDGWGLHPRFQAVWNQEWEILMCSGEPGD